MNTIFKFIKKQWKLIFYIIAIILMFMTIFITEPKRNQDTNTPIIINDFEVCKTESFCDELAYDYDLDTLNNLIYEQLAVQEKSHLLANTARALGWPEESSAIVDAQSEWHNAEIKIQFYSPIYNSKYEESDQIKWDKRKEEYPVATEIWLFLQNQGYSDCVCAGIVGNMMAEAGGQTLNIQPIIYNSSQNYYGICQWSKKYYPDVQGKDLSTQLQFLIDTIEYELNTYGRLYKSNFKYHNFLNLTNEKDVALAFAKSYERCNSKYYTIRQDNATKALEYFTS